MMENKKSTDDKIISDNSTILSDIKEYQLKFKSIDQNNEESIYNFLQSIEHMSHYNQMIITGWHRNHLRKIKRKLGLLSNRKFTNPRRSAPTDKKIPLSFKPKDRAEWNNKEWLAKMASEYSVLQIAQLLGYNKPHYLYARLKQFGIKPSTKEHELSRSKFRNKDWLYHKYVVEKRTLREIAKEAGVFHETIGRWLMKYNIPIRTTIESREKIEYWRSRIKHKIKKMPEIVIVSIKSNRIHIRLTSNILITWYTSIPKSRKTKSKKVKYENKSIKHVVIFEEDSKIVRIPKVFQSSYDDIGSNSNLWYANPKTVRKLSTLELEILAIRLIDKLVLTNFKEIKFPIEEIAAEIKSIKDFSDYQVYYKNKRVRIYHKDKLHSCFKTIFTYFRPIEHERLLKSRRIIDLSKRIMHSRRYDKSTLSFLENAHHIGAPRFASPICYKLLFSTMQPDSVLDLTPAYGQAAIAAATLNIDYFYKDDKEFTKAVNNGFVRDLGLNAKEYKHEDVDMVMYCGDMTTSTIDSAYKYVSEDYTTVCFVKGEDYEWARVSYKPSSIIPVNTKMVDGIIVKPDYWFVF